MSTEVKVKEVKFYGSRDVFEVSLTESISPDLSVLISKAIELIINKQDSFFLSPFHIDTGCKKLILHGREYILKDS